MPTCKTCVFHFLFTCICVMSTHGQNFAAVKYKVLDKHKLADAFSECSGLTVIGTRFFLHNDSGDGPYLYETDSSGQLLTKVYLAGAVNVDWEDMTRDDSNIYIGDFGNNSGKRTQCSIYSVPIRLLLKGADTISAQKKSFAFSDALHAEVKFQKHDYDCEAFYIRNDTFHFYSKNWKTKTTKHYVMANGSSTAQLKDTIQVKMLVTSAAYSVAQNSTLLLGYNKMGEPFVFSMAGKQDKPHRQSLCTLGLPMQCEALGIATDGGIYISNERKLWTKSKLFHLSLATLSK